ncbi:MAG: hypothetical protein A2583_12005 [Bdellovibrionales bacterium RIFOXYD1_FULL_53_11]|nr:MAG: hypothetical protein A2583_12005 [Bdellovibrionales bacterium RIFOXYD1_FULL_53_11]
MNRNELHPDLNREYKNGLESGVEKIDHPKCADMWFVVPPPPPKNIPNDLSVKLIAEAGKVISNQPNIDKASELDRLVSYLFLRKEAVESSRIEGTMSTIDHVLTPGELFDEWKAKSEGASVRGYAYAIEAELKRVATDGLSVFTVDLVSRLHKQIMKHDPRFRGVPGKIRENPIDVVCIRGQSPKPADSIYNPAPPRHVRRCLRDVMGWLADPRLSELENAGMGMPLIVRMAVLHAHFEAIHPFSDGNGRVGRMLIALQIACNKKIPIYLSGYIEEEKSNYSKVLQAAQKRLNYAPIVEFFAEALIASSCEVDLTRKHIENLPAAWLKRGNFRKESTAWRALSWLMAHPIFTVKQLQEHFRVSPQSANIAVSFLQKKRIVRERTGYERNRVFAAEEVISLLSRRFGSSPEEAIDGAQHLMKNSL